MADRPVLYLDVDDTILMFPPWRDRAWWEANKGGAPANGVREFLEWARATCEVRWLTAWCTSGKLKPEGVTRLATLLKVPEALIAGCDNPLGWGIVNKTEGIDWSEVDAGREWAWVEDGINDSEMAVLKGRHVEDRYYHTNASTNPDALLVTLQKLQDRFPSPEATP